MIKPQQIKAVFFDMDGVLYDSMPNHESTWIESFKEYGINFTPEEVYMNEGRTGFSTIRIAFEKYLKRLPKKEEEEAIYKLKTNLINTLPKSPLMPGMQQLIKNLKSNGIKVFVVTGSRQPSLINKLNTDFGISPEFIVSGNDVEHGKPHPEPYLIAWKKSGISKDECVVVENAPMGIESAKAANIYTIGVNTGKLKNKVLLDAGADEVFANTSNLSANRNKIWPIP